MTIQEFKKKYGTDGLRIAFHGALDAVERRVRQEAAMAVAHTPEGEERLANLRAASNALEDKVGEMLADLSTALGTF